MVEGPTPDTVLLVVLVPSAVGIVTVAVGSVSWFEFVVLIDLSVRLSDRRLDRTAPVADMMGSGYEAMLTG